MTSIQKELIVLAGLVLVFGWMQTSQAEKAATPPHDRERGKKLYAESNCATCHSINNEGGKIGPPLDGISQHRNADFLYARLADSPEALANYAKLTNQRPGDLAPHIRLPAAMTKLIVEYLLTVPKPSGGFAISSHTTASVQGGEKNTAPPNKESIEAGRALYQKFGCAQCHQIQNAGGYFGPRLDAVWQRMDRDNIRAHITNAQVHAVSKDKFFKQVPTPMPKFAATPEEIEKITDYLMSLPDTR